MTVKAIDPWVNVSMGAMADTPFMQKVKEEYFKAGDNFFRNIEADELIELMDNIGVEKAFGLKPDLVTGPATSTSAAVDLVRNLSGAEGLNIIDPDSLPRLREILKQKLNL